MSKKDHIHHWHLDSPQPGLPTVEGRCACGACRIYPARWEEPLAPNGHPKMSIRPRTAHTEWFGGLRYGER